MEDFTQNEFKIKLNIYLWLILASHGQEEKSLVVDFAWVRMVFGFNQKQ